MAVRPRELQFEQHRAELQLVPSDPIVLRQLTPPPPRPRIVSALVFVALLIGTVGGPAIRSALSDPPSIPSFEPRPLPASALPGLDPFDPIGKLDRPRSVDPARGIVFVSCTRLWRADPDGTNRELLISVPGLSSPAFSPDGRTIAFLKDGRELWMAAADGTDARRIGEFALDGAPVGAYAMNLTWSSDTNFVAFALMTPGHDPNAGGSAIFVLDLAKGRFEKIGSGWPAPFFTKRKAGFGDVEEGSLDFATDGGKAMYSRHLSSDRSDLTLAEQRKGWAGEYRRGLVVLTEDIGIRRLEVSHDYYSKRPVLSVVAPKGYVFPRFARPSLSQDAERAFIDLQDPGGNLDIGILNTQTGEWTIRDYGWNAIASPAPVTYGPLTKSHVRDLLWDWQSSFGKAVARHRLLTGDKPDTDTFPFTRDVTVLATTFDEIEDGEAWNVTGTVRGKTGQGWAWREAAFRVSVEHETVSISAAPLSSLNEIATIDDALAYLETTLNSPVLRPTYLPPSAHLQMRWPVEAWSWGSGAFGSVSLRVPGAEKNGVGRGGRYGYLSLAFGDGLSFNLGCGAVNDPEETTVSGHPGMIDHLSGTTQVIWPTNGGRNPVGDFSVYGDLPPQEIKRVADGMVP